MCRPVQAGYHSRSLRLAIFWLNPELGRATSHFWIDGLPHHTAVDTRGQRADLFSRQSGSSEDCCKQRDVPKGTASDVALPLQRASRAVIEQPPH